MRCCGRALSLWRGPPLAEFAYESWAQPKIERLEELRLEALQERVETDLALGVNAELVRELELLVAQYPLRSGSAPSLTPASYCSGRQADALAAYRDARRALVETLGIEPTLALRQLERAILDQDPAPGLTLRSQDTEVVQPRPSLQRRTSSFVGRTREPREIRDRVQDDLGREGGVRRARVLGGEWLMPSLQGTKTIALGTRSATHIVSCAAPEGMSM